jgi:hypothetical protein
VAPVFHQTINVSIFQLVANKRVVYSAMTVSYSIHSVLILITNLTTYNNAQATAVYHVTIFRLLSLRTRKKSHEHKQTKSFAFCQDICPEPSSSDRSKQWCCDGAAGPYNFRFHSKIYCSSSARSGGPAFV